MEIGPVGTVDNKRRGSWLKSVWKAEVLLNVLERLLKITSGADNHLSSTIEEAFGEEFRIQTKLAGA